MFNNINVDKQHLDMLGIKPEYQQKLFNHLDALKNTDNVLYLNNLDEFSKNTDINYINNILFAKLQDYFNIITLDPQYADYTKYVCTCKNDVNEIIEKLFDFITIYINSKPANLNLSVSLPLISFECDNNEIIFKLGINYT